MAAGRREARGAKELPVGRLAPPLWVAPAGKRESKPAWQASFTQNPLFP